MSFLGKNIKKLGFGLMRLPMDGKNVDLEQTKQMVDLFMEKGFTYFDTAYGYINGKSEEAAKAALVDRYPRDSYQLATKLPAWESKVVTAKDAQDMFWTSLKRTGVDYFDCYLIHNLGGPRTEAFDKFGVWEFLAGQKKKGLIKRLGFSIHATADVFEDLLTKHQDMDFVQLQINYADWDDAIVQSKKCYEIAEKYNVPVIVMEPVKGGALANLPEQVSEILLKADPSASPASWAIRYAASLERAEIVLSGMSNLDQMRDNISFMEDFQPLDENEHAVIREAQEALSRFPQIPCTECRYCIKDCPKNVAIPEIFQLVNNYLVYNDLDKAKGGYVWATHFGAKASECISCGQCEAVCPQNISVAEELAKAAKLIEAK